MGTSVRGFETVLEPADLAAHLDDPAWRSIDCRFSLLDPAAGRRAYLESHIPGAVYADLDHDLAGPVTAESGRHPLPDPLRLADTFSAWGIDATTQVAVYDDGGGAIAARAWWLLRWQGHRRVAVLNRGFGNWRALGLPVERGAVTVSPKTFVPAQREGMTIDTAEILAAGDRRNELRLVDAREAPRFRGETEPIDSVAGHIPGTHNLPYTECLDADSGMRSADEIGTRLARVLGERSDEPWAVMCGSGVTACHLALAGLLAGYREPRLYAGSFSAWIGDPGRPVASGPGGAAAAPEAAESA